MCAWMGMGLGVEAHDGRTLKHSSSRPGWVPAAYLPIAQFYPSSVPAASRVGRSHTCPVGSHVGMGYRAGVCFHYLPRSRSNLSTTICWLPIEDGWWVPPGRSAIGTGWRGRRRGGGGGGGAHGRRYLVVPTYLFPFPVAVRDRYLTLPCILRLPTLQLYLPASRGSPATQVPC